MNLQEIGFGEGGKDYLNNFKNWKLKPKQSDKISTDTYEES
jgi:hypothetical protein